MSGYPILGQHNRGAMMNRGPYPYPVHQHSANHSRNSNYHPNSSEIESHYSNPYTDQKQFDNYNNNNGSKNKNNKNNDKKMAIHRPRLNRKNAPEVKNNSKLTTNFDPMKDRHMWAMWRTAVNGRIVDQVRKNEKSKHDVLMPQDDHSAGVESDGKTNMATYGKDLASAPPLSRFIRLNQKSRNIAKDLMNEGQGKLETTQFIFYGLPRVTVNTPHINRYMERHNRANSNNDYANAARNGHSNLNKGHENMNFYNGDPVQDY